MVPIIWAAILQPLLLYFHNCEISSKPFMHIPYVFVLDIL